MDPEHHRVLVPRLEVDGFHEPTLDLEAVLGLEPQFLDLAQRAAVEDIGIHVNQLRHPRRVVDVEGGDVAGLEGCGADGDRLAAARDRQAVEHLRAASELPRRAAADGQDVDRRAAQFADAEVDARVVGRPGDVGRRVVQRAGPEAFGPAGLVHQVEARDMAGEALVVEARVGDPAAIGRHGRAGVGALAVGQRGHGARRQVDGVDLGVVVEVLGVGLPDARHVDGPPIGGPPGVVVGELAVRDLARRASRCRVECEGVRVALLDRAFAVPGPGQTVHNRRALRPLGAARPLRELHGQDRVLVGHEHREGELLAVGRPREAGGGLLDVRQLRQLARRHPQHVNLGRAVTVREERDPRPVGRPHGRRVAPAAAGELAQARAGRVDNPDVAPPLVFQLVHPAAREDNLGAVRRDGRARDGLHVHEGVLVEDALLHLRRGRRRHQQPGEQDTGTDPNRTLSSSHLPSP